MPGHDQEEEAHQMYCCHHKHGSSAGAADHSAAGYQLDIWVLPLQPPINDRPVIGVSSALGWVLCGSSDMGVLD